MPSPDPPNPAQPPTLARRRGVRLSGRFPAFRHRNYRLFFAGQLVSVTGTWMQTLAQAWLVLSLTSSPFRFGLVSVLQFAPILVLGPVTGVVADRFPKRSVLLVTQSCSALLAGTLALLVATDRVTLPHVYVLALGLGIVNAFDMPARQSFAVEMVGRDDLMNAIALNSTLFNTGRIVGPALAGLLLAATGPALCFAVNAVSYLAVIASLLRMRLAPSVTASEGSGLARLREGLRFVRTTPAILMPITLVALVATFAMNFNVWIPLLAKKEFAVGADGFGVLMSALGLGSLAGALVLAFSKAGPRPRLMLVSAAVLAVAEVVLAVAASIPAHVAVAFLVLPIMGFGMSTTNAMANTLVQTASPAALRGRVMSVYMTCFAGTAPIGAFLAAAVADRFGTPTSIAAGGAITLAGALVVAHRFGAYRADAPALGLASMQAGSKD